MSNKERRETKGIRMGTSAKDVEVIGKIDSELIVEFGGAEMGVVRMGTAAQPAEVLGKTVRAGSSAKWIKVKRSR